MHPLRNESRRDPHHVYLFQFILHHESPHAGDKIRDSPYCHKKNHGELIIIGKYIELFLKIGDFEMLTYVQLEFSGIRNAVYLCAMFDN